VIGLGFGWEGEAGGDEAEAIGAGKGRRAEEGKGKSGITRGRGRMDKATPGRHVKAANVKIWSGSCRAGFTNSVQVAEILTKFSG
jgi:hypothetical protein